MYDFLLVINSNIGPQLNSLLRYKGQNTSDLKLDAYVT